jgi:hypothetical protein
MGHMLWSELVGVSAPVGQPAPRPGGGCCIQHADGMHTLYGKGAAACRGLGGLGQFYDRDVSGWFAGRIRPPARSFHHGAAQLGGGGKAKFKMKLIWAHRWPSGFWRSRRGRAWKRVSPGNVTPVMIDHLLQEIREWRRRVMSPPAPPRVRPPTPAPRPRPRLRPRPVPTSKPPATTLVSSVSVAPRPRAPRPPARPITGQPYAAQARHGVSYASVAPAPRSYGVVPR